MNNMLRIINKLFNLNSTEISVKLIKKLKRLKCCANCRYCKSEWDTQDCTYHKKPTFYDCICKDWSIETDLRDRRTYID